MRTKIFTPLAKTGIVVPAYHQHEERRPCHERLIPVDLMGKLVITMLEFR